MNKLTIVHCFLRAYVCLVANRGNLEHPATHTHTHRETENASPTKYQLARFSEGLIEYRKRELERFLKRVCSHPKQSTHTHMLCIQTHRVSADKHTSVFSTNLFLLCYISYALASLFFPCFALLLLMCVPGYVSPQAIGIERAESVFGSYRRCKLFSSSFSWKEIEGGTNRRKRE